MVGNVGEEAGVLVGDPTAVLLVVHVTLGLALEAIKLEAVRLASEALDLRGEGDAGVGELNDGDVRIAGGLGGDVVLLRLLNGGRVIVGLLVKADRTDVVEGALLAGRLGTLGGGLLGDLARFSAGHTKLRKFRNFR